jgi:hypothetical protein
MEFQSQRKSSCKQHTSFATILPVPVIPSPAKERVVCVLFSLRMQLDACLLRLLHDESEESRLILVPHLNLAISNLNNQSWRGQENRNLHMWCRGMQSCAGLTCLFDQKSWVFHTICSLRWRHSGQPSELELSNGEHIQKRFNNY